jgi:hypothetical protein
MQANLTSLLSWVSMEALNTPEPVVLLVLGGLFLVLSFRVRSRPNVAKVAKVTRPESGPVLPVRRPGSALLTHHGR